MVQLSLFTSALLAATASASKLKVIQIGKTPDGSPNPVHGWNSWGIQASGYLDGDHYNEAGVRPICDRLSSDLHSNYKLCGLDSGWSIGDYGDDHGRILYDPEKFDLPNFATYLHKKGLKIGVYVVPGAFLKDLDKTIAGTNTKIQDICNGSYAFARCNFNYEHPDTQKWFDSNAKQFAQWGVDYVKLDFITPGSNDNNAGLPPDESQEVVMWQKAIKKSGRKITLAISWKLEHHDKHYFDIWRANADSMRVDQDIQTYSIPFTSWSNVIRTLKEYLSWINDAVAYYDTIGSHPNLDTMYVLNNETLSGLTLDQRKSVLIHWIGSSAEMNIGDDLTQPTKEGLKLLNDKDALSAAEFTANFPMQPRNPGSGENAWMDQNAWIAGPSRSGEFIAVLANYADSSESITVSATLKDLGVSGSYKCLDVLGKSVTKTSHGLSARLQGGQSVMYRCTRH
ncbi:glycoside hydrolase family 27 protein [Mariannaea sp. PMI_226]|nr:glycoside hydrolase family 27 protein [Mariannaea sp. PMI_226]